MAPLEVDTGGMEVTDHISTLGFFLQILMIDTDEEHQDLKYWPHTIMFTIYSFINAQH